MIEINPGIFIAQLITFLAALFILWKFAWGPLLGMLKERQDKIKKDLDVAESARQSIEKLQQEYSQKLSEIQQKAAELVSQAKQDGERMKGEILKIAQSEAEELRKKTQEQLDGEKKRISAELRSELSALSISIAEKIIRQSIDKKMQDNLFKEALDGLDAGTGKKPS
ncbi:MAG: ATP synthase F0 subunit B [Elusimicrobia bacterium RIFOXYB2_FULL_48_7]|nr:MAG: ATP synthase F0 subunit B [Elusimicrobia bacterium RIFOXYB2_FULL_48_7]